MLAKKKEKDVIDRMLDQYNVGQEKRKRCHRPNAGSN